MRRKARTFGVKLDFGGRDGVVGAVGFEPTASWSRTKRASQAAPRPVLQL